MKLLNRYSILLTVLGVILLGSCTPDETNPCPDIQFSVDIDSVNNTVAIKAEGIEDLTYQWYVNDVLIDSVNLDDITDDIFDFEFEPGTYNVCITAQSEQCDRTLEFCQEVEIPDPNQEECLGLQFRTDKKSDHAYKFFAEFDGIENVEYTWWVNDDSIKTEPLGADRAHFIEWEFPVGEHIVCIVAESEDCGEVEYCKEIVVEQVCPEELFFEKVEQEGHNTYKFIAEFENQDHTPYVWYINDDIVDKENFEDFDTDHKLFWQFDPGVYTICIVAELEGCDDVEFCIELVVENDCLEEVFFDYEKENDNIYVFHSDFEGMEHAPYKWIIDDEIVDKENFDGFDTDHKLVWDFDPGEYSVCIVTDQEGCESVEYCETVVVDEVCREISFTGAQDEGTNTFTFTADFDGKDDVTYIWTVYINDVKQGDEVREAGSNDDHQFSWEFDEGVEYEICLRQDGDCDESQLCKVFSLPN